MTSSHTVKIAKTSDSWIGTFDPQYTGEWLDTTLLLVSKIQISSTVFNDNYSLSEYPQSYLADNCLVDKKPHMCFYLLSLANLIILIFKVYVFGTCCLLSHK